jgi:hypothetical protein
LTTTLTKPKLNLEKEDLVFRNFICSDVTTFNSKKGNPLISVKLIGSKFSVLPGMLYFGKSTYEEVELLRGQRVNVILGASEQGFNIKDIESVN